MNAACPSSDPGLELLELGTVGVATARVRPLTGRGTGKSGPDLDAEGAWPCSTRRCSRWVVPLSHSGSPGTSNSAGSLAKPNQIHRHPADHHPLRPISDLTHRPGASARSGPIARARTPPGEYHGEHAARSWTDPRTLGIHQQPAPTLGVETPGLNPFSLLSPRRPVPGREYAACVDEPPRVTDENGEMPAGRRPLHRRDSGLHFPSRDRAGSSPGNCPAAALTGG